MSSSSYSSMLRDARWQRKRLEIMERDNFTCRSCGKSDKDDGTTLNVHHAFYIKGKKPWVYDEDMLTTWCQECHDKRHCQINELLYNATQFTAQEMSGLVICAHLNVLCGALYGKYCIPEGTMVSILNACDKAYNEEHPYEGGE